jgi:hypothetical protein
MIDANVFVEFVVVAWGKGHPASFLLDGRPVTLKFRKDTTPAIGISGGLAPSDTVLEWMEGDKGPGIALIFSRKDDSPHVSINAVAEIEMGEGIMRTDAMELMIDPSSISLMGFGPFETGRFIAS